MPQITKATVQNFGAANSRLEFRIVVEFNNDATQTDTYNFNVSNNKHCLASYLDSNAPSAAAKNTIVAMSETDFSAAFNLYAKEMAAKLVGKNSDTFNPSAAENRLVVSRIAFVSDQGRLGGDVHCFPVVIGPVLTPKCVELTRVQLNDFKSVTSFLFGYSEAKNASAKADAKTAWERSGELFESLVGKPNELLDGSQVEMIKARLNKNKSVLDKINSKQSYLDRVAKAEQEALDARVGGSSQAGPSGAGAPPPYRSNG
ncbi:MAG: hypothetical protein AAFZ99_06935 [Pseudomonadota bacterium]